MDQDRNRYQDKEVYRTILYYSLFVYSYISDKACQWFMKSGAVPMDGLALMITLFQVPILNILI